MENGQKKLKELFDGRKIFNIPDYQRAYAWDESRQLPDFIEDIENQDIGRDYFLGTILFQERNDKHQGYDVIDIVDGQQRITTIIIFMKVLLDQLSERLPDKDFEEHGLDLVTETYVISRNRTKLQAISPDNDFFQSHIIGDDDGKNFIITPSQRRLYNAKEYFKKSLKEKSIAELLDFKTKLDSCTKVLTYSVKDTAEATLIFETTNDRGKGLTNLEKIKSFLMYKTYLAAGENTETYLSSIQERFAEIFRELEKFGDKLSEDSALQYHCVAFEKWTDKSDYQQPVNFIRKIINPLINKGSRDEALKFIDRFSKELKESFITLGNMMKSEIEAFRDLACLDRLSNFYPLLLKSYKLDQTQKKQNFESTCKLLEIYSFRVFSIQQTRSNTGQTTLFTAARDFSGKFSPLYDKITSLIKTHSPKKIFKEHLEYSNFYEFMNSKDISYLLWKYENHLRQTEQPICPKMSEKEFRNSSKKTTLTIEHIASQTPEKNGIIKNNSILPALDDEFLENHIHRLGNLTFDPATANSSKGNSNIEIKNSKYFQKAPYKTQNELDEFLTNGKWKIQSINTREKKIVDFCLKYWNPEYVDTE
ncbi:DUF262 domain-containing protein [Pseudomonas panipatensis]|uniref:Uncharacterized conserved protein, contains ParB-like and HNH nuclease domains n=1 Tax=Pseudomonas panipatensis TaxID=428992 RepID=A0A1G8FF11_9PSED|nr:DUF262 domain-containing protein [Pseudomonas panipatensis]SDH80748.1 Uncharacterized conserved protein, contains ParB-like and HNH nuclease domains [Pseudomonas panipatensis]SMP54093.1 Uncharacterized conserved protein, contains ParB-like and HNH nuclease domains [Pseudomonas panipatensis]